VISVRIKIIKQVNKTIRNGTIASRIVKGSNIKSHRRSHYLRMTGSEIIKKKSPHYFGGV